MSIRSSGNWPNARIPRMPAVRSEKARMSAYKDRIAKARAEVEAHTRACGGLAKQARRGAS